MSWNCDGISNKIQELLAFIKINNIYIVLLQELCLNSKIILRIPNFHTYRSDCPQNPGSLAYGGTKVLIHQKITQNLVHIPLNLILQQSKLI